MSLQLVRGRAHCSAQHGEGGPEGGVLSSLGARAEETGGGHRPQNEKKARASPEMSSTACFDVGKYIPVVPEFRESDVESYFGAFERIAGALSWPWEVWAFLLQCKLCSKAQEACVSLFAADDSL